MKNKGKKIIIICCLLIIVIIGIIGISRYSNKYNHYKGYPIAEKGVATYNSSSYNNTDKLFLEGEWEFYYGKYIKTNSEDLNKGFTYINIGKSWSDIKDENGKYLPSYGIASYRMVLKNYNLNDSTIININNTRCSYRIFINDSLVTINGKMTDDYHDTIGYSNLVWSHLTPYFVNDTDLEIVIEVSSEYCGGIMQIPYLQDDYTNRNDSLLNMIYGWIYLGVVIAYLIVVILKAITEIDKKLNISLVFAIGVIAIKALLSPQLFSIFQFQIFIVNYEVIAIIFDILTIMIFIGYELYLYFFKTKNEGKVKFPITIYINILAILIVILGVIFREVPKFTPFAYGFVFISILIQLSVLTYLFIRYNHNYDVVFIVIAYLGSFSIICDVLCYNGYVKFDLFHFYYISMVICIIAIILISNIQFRRAVKKNETLQLVEKELAEARNTIMLNQMKPHFVYNALNSIKYLVMTDQEAAEEAIDIFSKYLRTNMNMLEKKDNITFLQELEHTKHYVEIEELRFGNILKVEYHIGTTDFNIPPLTLQPIVENAIKHGVMMKTTGGTIVVSTYDDKNNYYIEVEDDGVGFDESILKNPTNSFGIKNIRARIMQMASGSIKITSQVGLGTKVVVVLPKKDNIGVK